jgi:hypothetical protein
MANRMKTNTIPNNDNWNEVCWIAVYHNSNKLQYEGQLMNNPINTAMFWAKTVSFKDELQFITTNLDS